MKRYRTQHTSFLLAAGCRLRVAVFVRSPLSGGRALPRTAGRWRSRFTMSGCQGKALAPPRGRPPSGTQAQEENPAQSRREREEARPGRKKGGRPLLRSRALQTSGEMHRAALGSNSRATLLSEDGAQVAAPAARVWGTEQGQVAPAPPESRQ